MRKTLRRVNLTRLIEALKRLGYVPYKPHEYKRGKFHVCIIVQSETRCALTLHRDRLRHILGGHEAVWGSRDLQEEMNKIMAKYHLLRAYDKF